MTDWQAWTGLIHAAEKHNVPLTAFSYFLVLDWSELQPWHGASLPAAGFTVGLFLWFDVLRKRAAAKGKMEISPWKIRLTIVMDRIRTVLVICWMAFAVYGFIALSYVGCKLPSWTAPLLEWRFGAASCVF